MATRTDILINDNETALFSNLGNINLGGISASQAVGIQTIQALTIGASISIGITPVYDDVYILVNRLAATDLVVLQTLSNQVLNIVNLPQVTPTANTQMFRLERNIPLTLTFTAGAAYGPLVNVLIIQGVQAGTLSNYIYLPPMGQRTLKPGAGSLNVETYQASTSVVQNGLRFSFRDFWVPLDENNPSSDYVIDLLPTKLPIQFNFNYNVNGEYKESISNLNPGNQIAVALSGMMRGTYVTGTITYEAPSIGSPTTPVTYAHSFNFTVSNQWDDTYSLRGGQAGKSYAAPPPGYAVKHDYGRFEPKIDQLKELIMELARRTSQLDDKLSMHQVSDALKRLG